MNKTEEMWYKHYKECNDLDYAQIERFDEKVQEDILRTKALIEMIEELQKEVKNQKSLSDMYLQTLCKSRKIIESFESGEMKVGEKYEQIP